MEHFAVGGPLLPHEVDRRDARLVDLALYGLDVSGFSIEHGAAGLLAFNWLLCLHGELFIGGPLLHSVDLAESSFANLLEHFVPAIKNHRVGCEHLKNYC